MTAASSLVLMSSLALAVDTGAATARQRSLGGSADMIALDAARAVGDRFDPAGNALADAERYAEDAALRNGFDPSAPGNALTVQLGTMNWATNTFTTPPPGGSAAADAVRVVVSTSVDHAFLPGTTTLQSESIAALDAQAGVQAGSSMADFDADFTPIDPFLGDMVGLSFDTAGYDALVGASLAFGDLWVALGLGSADEVADTEVSMTDLFDASITALGNQGDAASAAAASELSNARGDIKAGSSFTFGEWMEASGFSPNEAAGARINVLGLLAATAQVANGTNLIDVQLPVLIPGVSSVRMKLGVVETPRLAIGPARQDAQGAWRTVARSAQTRAQLELDIAKDMTVAGQTVDLKLPMYLETGGATAELRSIDCLTPFEDSPAGVRVVTQTSTGAVGVVNDASLLGGSVTIGEAVVGTNPLVVEIRASGTQTLAGDTRDFTFTGPFTSPPPPGSRASKRAGAVAPSLDTLAASMTVTATPAPGLGLLVNAATVAEDAKKILKPVIESLDQTLIPALKGLPFGFTFGGAEVTNTSLNCAIRRLTS